ncbi:MAG TPA: TerB family tellurite resistance protein [Candidatus Binatia bacterium]|nr:TerB family tellurite resistance protein [Candidatus Binatia bacterium]
MALPTQIEFLKVLACMAWADQEISRPEISLIGRLMHSFHLSGDERMQVEMYLEEKVDSDEAKRVTRRFLSRVRRPAERKNLVTTVETLLESDERRTAEERAWLQELHDAVAESSGSFLLDGLRSVLRIGAAGAAGSGSGREAQLHDFIHNRVLFKLRHRVGAKILERETNPDKLKELTLCAAFLARVGYVDEKFLPQEKQFIQKLLRDVWGVSLSLAEAVCGVAMEAVNQGLDLFRLIQETKATLSVNKRKTLLEALFALALAEGKMTGEEIEEIRKIAYGLEFTHREFINAKLKVLGRS